MSAKSRRGASFVLGFIMLCSLLSFAGAEKNTVNERKYSDMSETHWSYENVLKCRENGWFDCFSESEFLPDEAVTYEEAVKAVSAYSKRNIKTKLDEKYTDKNSKITREDMIYLIMSALDYIKEEKTANPFLIINAYSDYTSISEEMKALFSLATSKGIIFGHSDKTAKPGESLTRAQLASILCNAEASKEKNAFRDKFVKAKNITETNAIGVEEALLLQSTGDYFEITVNAPEDGYYEFNMDYSHDCYEITTKVKITRPDGKLVESNRGISSGRQKLSMPIYLEKGVNKVRYQHSLRQLPIYILPLYIYDVKCTEKIENLEYKISPANARVFLDNPKSFMICIKNWKDDLLKIETEEGKNIPFKAEVVGDNTYTEAMIRVYPDISKLSEGKYTLNYRLESGKILTQSLEIAEKTPQTDLEYINFSVEKANSTLIKLPNGKYLLVDSGYDHTAEEKIIPYLKAHNIKLDYYILTHFHKDHYGLKDEILEMNGIEKPSQEVAESLVKASKEERYNYLKNFGYLDSSMVCFYDELDKIWDLGGVKVELLNSQFNEKGEKVKEYNYSFYRIDEHNYENATSISFMLEYNGFRYYHAADNYAFCQQRYMSDMIASGRTEELSCDWYFGNHHFQYDMNPEFIKTLNPVAVFVPNDEGVYPRASYNQRYKNEVENCIFFGKRLEETLISHEVGSAIVYVNGKDDWYYETICDEDMYK